MELTRGSLMILAIFATFTLAKVHAVDRSSNDYYVAGVLEYSYLVSNGSFDDSVQLNLDEYARFMKLAKAKGVDVLVFPEATLNHDFVDTRENLAKVAVVTPDPDLQIAPCDQEENYSYILVQLSRAARDNEIYILVNLVEKMSCSENPEACKPPYNVHGDGYCLYNTNIVFDRQGRLISRYRKMNLFIEPRMDEPHEQPLPIFETDFGVTFGHFICFDVMFKDPARILVQQHNITNFLYPTYWYEQLPFFVAETIHQGWAYSNNVNFLVSGANVLHFGTSGAGIYLGRKRIQTIVTTGTAIRKLYTAKVPKNVRADFVFTDDNTIREESTAADLLSLYVSSEWSDKHPVVFPLNEPLETVCVNDGKICCEIEIKKTDLDVSPEDLTYRYALTVNYTNKLYIEKRNISEITCAIISCTGESPDSCGRRFEKPGVVPSVRFDYIRITTKIRSDCFEDVMIAPNTVTSGFLPFTLEDYNLTSTDVYKEENASYKNFTIETQRSPPEFLVFGVFGRDFASDVGRIEDLKRLYGDGSQG